MAPLWVLLKLSLGGLTARVRMPLMAETMFATPAPCLMRESSILWFAILTVTDERAHTH